MGLMYPPGPSAVADDLAAPSPSYKSRARVAFLSLLLFIALYLSLTGWFGWTAYKYFVNATGASGSGAFIGYGLALAAGFLTVFLVKGLFFVSHGGEVNDIEITADEQPQLINFLYRLADEAGAPRPHRVFLSGRVNAAVFYDLTLLNLLFPSKKNLEIGLPLVNGLTLGELKAVLAHEFGHFRQGSMAVGRWVYVAQQVATHIIQERDILDRFLSGLSRFDIRIAWVGWILRLIVWALRAILDTAFSLVVLAQRSLSREMEFHADLVSVSLTGSDALVHALHRLHAADDAWDRALGVASQELGEGRAVTDVFVIQKIITQRMKEILDDEFYDAPPPLPETNPEEHRVFDTEMAHPPRMWSTHPPNRAREDNAKSRYVAAPVDQRPAWDLFKDPQKLREEMTAHLLNGSPGAKELPKASLTETVACVKKQYGKVVYDRRYRGTYMGRSPVREFATVEELFGSCNYASDLKGAIALLYPENLPERLEDWRNLEEQRANLQAIYDGTLTSPDGVIRHHGKIVKRRQLPSIIRKLGGECDQARKELAAHDKIVRAVHRAAASSLGPGWVEYHNGLVSLLHYADHTEANLNDARGRLNNLWSVVIADGKVTSGEVKQLLVAAEDIQNVMRAIDHQKQQLQLCRRVTAAVGGRSWPELLNEDFNLAPPSKENIGDWLGVLDSWANYFQFALSTLRQESLETLLAAENFLRVKATRGEAVGNAPAPATVPAEYPTLLPNTERKLQTRLGLSDRFQTADGFFPGLARFLVAGSIVGGLLGLGMSTTDTADVTIYNGLATPVVVMVGAEERRISPMSTARLESDSNSNLQISTHSADGMLIESIEVDASNSFVDYVYNVAGAAPLVEWTAVYGSKGERPPSYIGAPVWLSSDADYIFAEPPEQIETSGDGGTRDVLEGFGNIDPQYLSEFLPPGAATEQLVRVHATWDNPNSKYVTTWLVLATMQDNFPEVLAQRLQRDENEVLSLRFEQDVTDGADATARVCARHTERASQLPGNADWQYLSIRCQHDGPARDDAFLEAHKANPDHAWTAGAAGYTYAARGQWADAQSALDNAFTNLPAMRASYADEVARIRRMQHGVHSAEMSDLTEHSQWLQLLLETESTYGVSEPALQPYASLAAGELSKAVSESVAAGDYTDEILRLAAASDGAPQELIRKAKALGVYSGIDANTLGIAIGFAHKTGAPTEALLGQLEQEMDDQARFLQEFYAIISQRVLKTEQAEQALYGAEPLTRGRAYAMGAAALGDRAPRSWRDAAKRLLFVTERPYFF